LKTCLEFLIQYSAITGRFGLVPSHRGWRFSLDRKRSCSVVASFNLWTDFTGREMQPESVGSNFTQLVANWDCSNVG